MAVEVLAPLVDALIAVIASMAEFALALLRSCFRSLRFAFSPSFRAAERERLSTRGPLYRVAYATWGIAAVAGLLALVGAIAYWASRPELTPREACAKLELQRLAGCAQAIREAMPK